MTARTWTIRLPAGLKPLSPNHRLHFAERNRRAQAIKKAAWVLTLQQKIPAVAGLSVIAVWHPPDRRDIDFDNIPPATAKPAIDGVVAAHVIPDDSKRYVTGIRYEIGSPVKGGQLVLVLNEEAPGGGAG